MIEYRGEVHVPSRIVRTLLAALILVISVAMIGVKYVYMPIKHGTMPDLPIVESVFHVLVIVAAVMMYDPKTGQAIADSLLAKLPGGK